MSRLDDGHSTRIAFAEEASVLFFEKEVTPPGIEGGGANDTTTMLNTIWRTKAPKKLKSLKDASVVVAYDPAVFPQIVDMINVNQLITVTYADGATLVFWGWIDDFSPARSVEGEQPTAEVTIIPSNQNDSLVEAGPVLTPA